MKKFVEITILIIILTFGLFVFTGCGEEKKEENKENNANSSENTTTENETKKDSKVAEISYEIEEGKITLLVQKNEDGTPKYEFTATKPEGFKQTGTCYLVTDSCFIAFSRTRLTYNTTKEYKEKYGDNKATFDGYIDYISENSENNFPGLERIDIGERKAARFQHRISGTKEYWYYGYYYMVSVDDVYPGSKFEMIVNFRDEEKPSEPTELDEETLSIINSLKIELKK